MLLLERLRHTLTIALALPLALLTAPAVFSETLLLRPDRVFDGESMHAGWVV